MTLVVKNHKKYINFLYQKSVKPFWFFFFSVWNVSISLVSKIGPDFCRLIRKWTQVNFDWIKLLSKNLDLLAPKLRSCYLVYSIHSKRVVLFIAEICRYLIKAPSLFSPYFLRPKPKWFICKELHLFGSYGMVLGKLATF